jgi:hypothetical protein
VSAGAAVVVIEPFFGSHYANLTSHSDGFNVLLLIGVYSLLALMTGMLYRHHPYCPNWFRAGCSVGLLIALLTFLAVQIVSGYAMIDPRTWVLSCAFDMLGPFIVDGNLM